MKYATSFQIFFLLSWCFTFQNNLHDKSERINFDRFAGSIWQTYICYLLRTCGHISLRISLTHFVYAFRYAFLLPIWTHSRCKFSYKIPERKHATRTGGQRIRWPGCPTGVKFCPTDRRDQLTLSDQRYFVSNRPFLGDFSREFNASFSVKIPSWSNLTYLKIDLNFLCVCVCVARVFCVYSRMCVCVVGGLWMFTCMWWWSGTLVPRDAASVYRYTGILWANI